MSSPVASGPRGRDRPVVGGGDLWSAVDRLLASASLNGIQHNGLGPLEANRLRRAGETVPPVLQREERATTIAAATTAPLLQRVRASCDGPLVLFKGPEVAHLYPPNGRHFGDLDVLTAQAEAVRRSLRDAGFLPDQKSPSAEHHLEPLIWPTSPLSIEVHGQLNWPSWLREPELGEIIEACVPSAEFDGFVAPAAHHHCLIIAAHSWKHRPLRGLRDLLDVAVVAAQADEGAIESTATEWGLDRIWRTTRATVDALFYGERRTVPLRSWARHLWEVRERTLLEHHYELLMSGFWAKPPRQALGQTARALYEDFAPLPDETWRRKLRRSAKAVRDARVPFSRHEVTRSADETNTESDGD